MEILGVGADKIKEKFGYFFRTTAYLFRPYLELKYNPKKNQKIQDRLHSALVYIATWVVIGVVYIGFVYLFIYKDAQGNSGHISDIWEKSPAEIFTAFLHSASVAPVFNIMFLIVLYYAIISFAEKEYLNAIYVHTKISGLLKVIKLGKFDSTGKIIEQGEEQVLEARRNVLATLADPEKEAISILAPSGYDFFGTGKALGGSPAPVKPYRYKWMKWCAEKITSSSDHLNNGYVLKVVAEQTRNVRIILLDPDGEAVKKRANDYFGHESHRPIRTPQEYSDGIRFVINNLRDIYQTKKNRNIELKIIDKLPDWKMVLVEGEVWVQPIIPGARSDHAPVYGFKKSESSMYYAYFCIFDELWHDKNSVKVDLSIPSLQGDKESSRFTPSID